MPSPLSQLAIQLQAPARWTAGTVALVAMLAAAVSSLVGLGAPGLLDPWEMDRAAVARTMAGPQRVHVVADAEQTAVLSETIRATLGEDVAVLVEGSEGRRGAAAVEQLRTTLAEEVAHAAIVDIAHIVPEAPTDARFDKAHGVLERIRDDNPGTTLLLLTDDAQVDADTARFAAAAARQDSRALHGRWHGHALPAPADAEKIAALYAPAWRVIGRSALGPSLDGGVPSPWLRPAHKLEGVTRPAPFLDAALVGLSMRSLGATEFAARLPGALCLIVAVGLLAFAAARLAGPIAGLLAALVALSMPIGIATGRALTLEAGMTLAVGMTTCGLVIAAVASATRDVVIGSLVWALGLLVAFLARGLGGLTMTALVAVGALLVAERRRLPAAFAAVSVLGLGFAALFVLRVADDPFWLSMRFHQFPFDGGLREDHRDFASLVGSVGFGVYPWGALMLLGLGRLLAVSEGWGAGLLERGEAHGGASDTDARRIIALGFGVPIIAVAGFVGPFSHTIAPVLVPAALATALLLDDVRRGRVRGVAPAFFILIATLLLHREIGKGAETVLRVVAFDPPFGDTKQGAVAWPPTLLMPRAARAVAFLAITGFTLVLIRPASTVRAAITRLREPRTAAWVGAGGLIGWALAVLIGMGVAMDRLLKADAAETGYRYDRVWTQIQMTRPEVIAGAALFVVLLLALALRSIRGDRPAWPTVEARSRPLRALATLRSLTALLGRPLPALIAVGAGAIGTLIAGLMVFAGLHDGDYTGALQHGLARAAFWWPLLVGLLSVAAAFVGPRLPLVGAAIEAGGWGPTLRRDLPTWLVGVALVATAGVGVGASQAGGTWTYGYLAGCWGLATALALVLLSRSGGEAQRLVPALVAIAATVAGVVFAVLWQRRMDFPADRGPSLAKALVVRADLIALLALAGAAAALRAAERQRPLAMLRDLGLRVVELIERPRPAVALASLAGVTMAGAYAFALLPGLSVHFSQKHLLGQIDTFAGEQAQAVFKYPHGPGREVIGSNFYTADMPTVRDEATLLAVLSGENALVEVQDDRRGERTKLALPGWSTKADEDSDGQRDAPAFLGVAKKVDGIRVEVDALPTAPHEAAPQLAWDKNVWKGGTLLDVDGKHIDVVESGPDWVLLAQPAKLVAGDLRRGRVVLDKLPSERGAAAFAADSPAHRFAVVPRDGFSALNEAFRKAHGGRHLSALDAESSRLVLVTSAALDADKDDNWLRRVTLDKATFEARDDISRVDVDFDGKLKLAGYRFESKSVARSEKYRLYVYFEVIKPVGQSLKIFMHPHPLHRDLWPVDYTPESKDTEKRCVGCYQTDHWRPGDVVEVEIAQEVPLGTSSGMHDVILGLYNPQSDKRLPIGKVSGPGVHRHNDNRVTLTRLQVR